MTTLQQQQQQLAIETYGLLREVKSNVTTLDKKVDNLENIISKIQEKNNVFEKEINEIKKDLTDVKQQQKEFKEEFEPIIEDTKAIIKAWKWIVKHWLRVWVWASTPIILGGILFVLWVVDPIAIDVDFMRVISQKILDPSVNYYTHDGFSNNSELNRLRESMNQTQIKNK